MPLSYSLAFDALYHLFCCKHLVDLFQSVNLASMVSVPLTPSTKTAPRGRRLGITAVAAGVAVGTVSALALRKQKVSPLKKVREDLLVELASTTRTPTKVEELTEMLAASRPQFDEALMGGGAWKVVYSRQPLLWQSWEYDPLGRRVTSKGQLGPWDCLYVTAEGSYEPQVAGPMMPTPIQASFTSGALHCWGHQIPLPIRSTGIMSLTYSDDSLRVFTSKNGAVTVQIREDRLASLLPAQK